MTDQSTAKDGDELYDLAPPAEPAGASPKAAGPRRRAEPVTLASHAAPVGVKRGFDEQRFKDFQLPLALLCGGIVIEVVAAFFRTSLFELAMRHVGVNLIAGTILMLAGIIPAARWRGIELGQFWTVVLKLAAITVAPSAVVRLASPVLDFVPLGSLVGWIGEFVLYFALLGVLFDLDESDTWYCVCVIFLVRLAVYFMLLAVMGRWS